MSRAVHGKLKGDGINTVFLDPKRPTFADPYLERHMAALAQALWEGQLVGPRNLLGTNHWIHLSAAWFHAVDQHLLRPAIDSGAVVVSDTWYHKLLARFRVKSADAFAEARQAYRTLTEPDRVIVCRPGPRIGGPAKDDVRVCRVR